MTVFEYVLVLISLIIGLAIAEGLASVARTLGGLGKQRPYWVQLLQVTFILLLAVNVWWVSWQLHDRVSWALPTLLLFLIGPTAIYLAARLASVGQLEDTQPDEYYFAVAPRVYLLLLIALIWGYAGSVLLLEQPIFSVRTLPNMFAGILLVCLALTRRRWAHGTVLILLLLLLALTTALRGPVITDSGI